MALHKALMESERVGYEGTFGKIGSPNEFLRLMLQDPWFAWLRPISELMVQMDEALDAEEPLSADAARRFVESTTTLLKPIDTDERFGKQYLEAMQREPEVVLAHAAVLKVVRAA